MPLRWLTNCGKDEARLILNALVHETPGRRLTTGEPIPSLIPNTPSLDDLKRMNMVGVYEIEGQDCERCG